MKRLFIVLVILFGCNGQYDEQPNMAHIRKGLDRAVEIESGQVTCSGVIYQTSYVLTAAHCIQGYVEVNNSPAYLLKKDDKADLALLFVWSNKAYEPLSISSNIHMLDKVFVVADPTGIRVVSLGRVLKVDGDMVMINTVTAPGASGGGLYDRDGNLIGILNTMRTAHESIIFGAAVHGRAVRRFLEQ